MALTKPRAYQIYDIDYKQATRAVTVANVTLTAGAPNNVDGVNLSVNDRVLVTGQTNQSQNGVYVVVTLGTGANGTWTRSGDTDLTGELLAGTIIMVTEGLIYADTQWKLITDNPITIGTTPLIFTQNYLANVIQAGNSNVTVYSNANITVTSGGTANVLTISNTGIAILGTVSSTGNITANVGSFFIGNGSQLSGIATGTANSIENGTSNVTIPIANGSIEFAVGGVANTLVIDPGSLTMYGSFATPKTILSNVTISENVNAMLYGPMTVGEGVGITVPTTSTLYVYGSA
jgi:hypothetical protein